MITITETKMSSCSKYPYVGKAPGITSTTVLFTAEKTGMCIASSDSDIPVGYYSAKWAEEWYYAVPEITIKSEV